MWSPPSLSVVNIHDHQFPHQGLIHFSKATFKFIMNQWMTCTHLNGEDSCVSDQERFDLEGLAEGSSLVHGAHSCCLICIDVLPQLLSEWKNTQPLQLQLCGGTEMYLLFTLHGFKLKLSLWLTLTSPQLSAALPEPWGHGWSHLLKSPAQFHPVGREKSSDDFTSFIHNFSVHKHFISQHFKMANGHHLLLCHLSLCQSGVYSKETDIH